MSSQKTLIGKVENEIVALEEVSFKLIYRLLQVGLLSPHRYVAVNPNVIFHRPPAQKLKNINTFSTLISYLPA